MKITRQQAADTLLGQDCITILCHANPDGDTVGSAYALCRALQILGKRAQVKCGDKITERFSYVMETVQEMEFDEQYVVSVDVADDKLLGSLEQEYKGKIDLCIDHHGSNTQYAGKLLLETAAANAEITYEVIKLLGVPIDSQIAKAIYTGIATDTGCFKFQNTTAQSHKIAAELFDIGFEYAQINYLLFDMRTRERIDLEKTALETMEFHFEGKCAVVALTKDLIESVDSEDMNGISALSRQISGVEIGVTMKEKETGVWKVSLRSNEYVNTQAVCSAFGGGGHKRAAGCKLKGTMEECKQRLLAEIEKHL